MPLQAVHGSVRTEVLSLLGAGGMGEVWLATELRLGRKVALKLLPSDLTRDPARVLRFEQEARAASALNHPNVCTIHALGETSEGEHYIAMEYVEGETLRRRLARSRLTVTEALDTAIQVAAALGTAHPAGIVHRDIKPENVMLRPDGVVKVLDFGLAKLAPASPRGCGHHADGLQDRRGNGAGHRWLHVARAGPRPAGRREDGHPTVAEHAASCRIERVGECHRQRLDARQRGQVGTRNLEPSGNPERGTHLERGTQPGTRQLEPGTTRSPAGDRALSNRARHCVPAPHARVGAAPAGGSDASARPAWASRRGSAVFSRSSPLSLTAVCHT